MNSTERVCEVMTTRISARQRRVGAVTALALVGLLVGGLGQASAMSIVYFVDGNNGTDQMAAALAALAPGDTTTLATSPTDFSTKIAEGTFDLGIFSAQKSYGADDTSALGALATFVAGGGKSIVDSWATFSPDLTGFDAAFTGNTNGPAVNLTAFNSGVISPVAISNQVPAYGTFSTGLSALAGGSLAGTFFDPGNASGTDGQGAIVVGNSGRSIVNGFLNDIAGASGRQIYENEIDGLAGGTPVPEPASVSLLGIGLAVAWTARRRAR